MKPEDIVSPDTPRTNAQLVPVFFVDGKVTYAVDPDFAKSLEREIKQLENKLNETRAD
jgi:hypothetical protein